MITIRHLLLIISIAFVFSASNAGADTWAYDPVKTDQIEKFGDTRIVLTTDARKNRQYPDFILSIYLKNELRAKYRGLAYEQFFSSPDNSYFLGLSNNGLPGSAVVLFDKYGRLMLEVKHGFAAFDYCDNSVTLVRRWFDEKNPGVSFIMDKKYGGFKSVTLRDCRGNKTDLMSLVLQAYSRSLQRTAASGVR